MSEKPRVIAMTDGEIDDQCSMIRFLPLHANDMEVVAIIQTNSIFQRGGWSNAGWIEKQLDAYEQVYPYSIVPSCLSYCQRTKKQTFLGDQDSTHIVVDTDVIRRVPGTESMIDPTHWADTPGSDKIVETLLENDPRKVYIQAWGGVHRSQSFPKVKNPIPFRVRACCEESSYVQHLVSGWRWKLH